ncbi:MAG: hypothetical protein SWO11_02335 [Thermodesulfobacteriota bacterium]|nr:hypothetical protein [Thermodesulfobacteriota bacterium]
MSLLMISPHEIARSSQKRTSPISMHIEIRSDLSCMSGIYFLADVFIFSEIDSCNIFRLVKPFMDNGHRSYEVYIGYDLLK